MEKEEKKNELVTFLRGVTAYEQDQRLAVETKKTILQALRDSLTEDGNLQLSILLVQTLLRDWVKLGGTEKKYLLEVSISIRASDPTYLTYFKRIFGTVPDLQLLDTLPFLFEKACEPLIWYALEKLRTKATGVQIAAMFGLFMKRKLPLDKFCDLFQDKVPDTAAIAYQASLLNLQEDVLDTLVKRKWLVVKDIEEDVVAEAIVETKFQFVAWVVKHYHPIPSSWYFAAIKSMNPTMIKLLFDPLPPKTNIVDENGNTLLQYAVQQASQFQLTTRVVPTSQSVEVEALGIQLRANRITRLEHDQELKDLYEWRHSALFQPSFRFVQFLIVDKKQDVNFVIQKPGKAWTTPLHTAVSESNLILTKYLLQQGAEPLLKNHTGHTPADDVFHRLLRAKKESDKDKLTGLLTLLGTKFESMLESHRAELDRVKTLRKVALDYEDLQMKKQMMRESVQFVLEKGEERWWVPYLKLDREQLQHNYVFLGTVLLWYDFLFMYKTIEPVKFQSDWNEMTVVTNGKVDLKSFMVARLERMKKQVDQTGHPSLVVSLGMVRALVNILH